MQVSGDVAFLGIPYDGGVGYRPGTRFGPNALREYRKRFTSWGVANAPGYWTQTPGSRQSGFRSRTDQMLRLSVVEILPDCGAPAQFDWKRKETALFLNFD
ncbi:arginase family protein [Mesorhizobium sp. M0410]|uniref:arginase family protein n=1 Tax=Mesorhizobium sp. M0410 TaxID=2956943 RepID=UPI0033387689